MDTGVIKPVKFNSKQLKRLQAKKRKLEALVNLFKLEEETIMAEKKQKEDYAEKKRNEDSAIDDSLKVLKNELKKYVKKTDVKPNFYFTHIGFKSKYKIKKHKAAWKGRPLFVDNVYELLLRSVIGHMSPYNFNWCKLEQPQNISGTVLLVIEDLPISALAANQSSLLEFEEIFKLCLHISLPNVHFPRELIAIHEPDYFHLENDNSYSTMFPKKKGIKIQAPCGTKKISKLHLLLTPIQLLKENCPLPQGIFPFSKSLDYTYSKEFYKPVTVNSPMFAIDFEMCGSEKADNELTRIAVVNEDHEVVYETLVKPKSKIVDYRTKFSGITAKKLKGVTTSLKDVQNKLRAILPSDAILCGHSLNCDLHSLYMIHPYCIDTSVIFNCNGMCSKKESLKNLTMEYLKEDIQNDVNGHDPIEDALATMKLVQYQLNNPTVSNDACVKLNKTSDDDNNDIVEASNGVKTIDKKVELFELTSKHKKHVCLIGSKHVIDLYGSDHPDNVKKIIDSDIMSIAEKTITHMGDNNLVISHLNFDFYKQMDKVRKFNQIVKLVFDSCSTRTMFMVLTSDVDDSYFEDIKSGLFMATLKKNISVS